LNTQNRYTHPELFVADESGDEMYYFDVPRIGAVAALTQRRTKLVERNSSATVIKKQVEQPASDPLFQSVFELIGVRLLKKSISKFY
jgi:hypothetical protein